MLDREAWAWTKLEKTKKLFKELKIKYDTNDRNTK
jgi:hypothetical protein